MTFSYYTFTDAAGRHHWQRTGRYANPEGEGYATAELASRAALRRAALERIHQSDWLAALARAAYPRRLTGQEHFRRGFIAACGDESWTMIGSYAEEEGAREAERCGRAGTLPPTPRELEGRAQLAAIAAELCDCGECHRLDRRHPHEGAQLVLPGTATGRAPIAAQQVLL